MISPNPFVFGQNKDIKISNLVGSLILNICDKHGEIVRTFKKEEINEKGILFWDGKNDEGANLTEGSYSLNLLINNENKKSIKLVCTKRSIFFVY
ncbi:MAG: FlgD immunoglobulin-like domain containing protein [Candidatus Firestonebacteria bacterium]